MAHRHPLSLFMPRPAALAVRSLLGAALLAPLGPLLAQTVTPAAPAGSAAEAPRAYAIPAGPLAAALTCFAAESGLLLAAPAGLTQGPMSPGLNGRYTAAQGFEALLQGSGLEALRQPDGSYGLRPRAGAVQTPPPAAEEALPVVRGRASRALDAPSEGSGSLLARGQSSATGLSLSLRDTPQAVAVITRERLSEQQLVSVEDVLLHAPGITFKKKASADDNEKGLFARGMEVSNMLVDGVSMPKDFHALGLDTALYDRIEVVRGATGLMQGAGNPSAAINLIRKRPTREFQASLEGSLGSWDRYRTEVDVSGPLDDTGAVRGRMVTAYQTGNSYRDTLDNERSLFYGIMEADLNDSTTLTLSASRQQDNNNGNGWTGLPVGFDGSDLHLSRSTSLSNDWEYWNKTSTSTYAALEHLLDNGWKLNISATRTWADLDMLGTYLLGRTATKTYDQYVGAGHYRETQNSFDAYASGPFRLMDRDHELVVGAAHRRVVFDGDVPYNILLKSNIDLYNWDSGATPKPKSQDKYDWQNTNAKLNSVYATTRLSLADPLKLILGSRLDWYENNTSAPYKGTHSELKVTRHATKYAGLIYDLNDNHSVYVSYTDIFKPQSSLDTSGKTIAPITGENLELGIKGEYFDGALNASAAIFQIDQENRAKAITDQSLCPSYPATSCYEASGKVRSKGVELEVQGQLTPGWELAAGYTFAEAKYVKDAKKDNEGRLFDTDIPRHLFKMSTTYTLPGELDQWRVGTSLYHQNRIYNKGTTYLIEQDGYTLVDFMLGFKATEHLDARLNLNNAFNKKYYNSLSSSVTVPSNVYGDPRNLMLSVKYTY